MNYVDPKLQARQTQIVEVLELVCESLELSPSQFASAKQRYEGVGACLAGSDDPVLQTIAIYLQGSTALRTTVKPIGVNEHDVDLVAHVPDLDVQISPAALKKAIGDCLRGNGNYAPLLEEMPRCWRLNYANEFHMDITPSIPNPACRFGGELVPDKTLKVWKASNPKGYKRPVRAARQAYTRHSPPQAHRCGQHAGERRTVPEGRRLQGHLAPHGADRETPPRHHVRRRSGPRAALGDHHHAGARGATNGASPTTSTTTSSTCCSTWSGTCRTPSRCAASTAAITGSSGTRPLTGENFAEKWNRRPERAEAFFTWHARFCSDLVAARSRPRAGPFGQHVEELVRLPAGERRDRFADGAGLDSAPRRQSPRGAHRRTKRRRGVGIDVRAGQHLLRKQPLAPC